MDLTVAADGEVADVKSTGSIVSDGTGSWEKLVVKIDSGAVDSCLPKELLTRVPVRETAASKNDMRYVAANGTNIRNYGERNVQGLTGDWKPMNMTFQVTDVRNLLGSVYRMVQSGNTVTFDDRGGRIINKRTGKITPIRENRGAYELDVWLPVKEGGFGRQGQS